MQLRFISRYCESKNYNDSVQLLQVAHLLVLLCIQIVFVTYFGLIGQHATQFTHVKSLMLMIKISAKIFLKSSVWGNDYLRNNYMRFSVMKKNNHIFFNFSDLFCQCQCECMYICLKNVMIWILYEWNNLMLPL